MFNFMITPVVRALLIVNFAAYVVSGFLFPPLAELFSLKYIFAKDFYPFQFFTYMFLHGDFSHVFFNMLSLFFIGPMLEMYWGSKKFMYFYFIVGIGAGVIYSIILYAQMYGLNLQVAEYVANSTPEAFLEFLNKNANAMVDLNQDFLHQFSQSPQNEEYMEQSRQAAQSLFESKSRTSLVGASGATYGLLMAYGLLFPRREMMIFPFPFPIKAWIFILCIGGLELILGILDKNGDIVAHFAHVSGMAFAFIMIKLWKEKANDF